MSINEKIMQNIDNSKELEKIIKNLDNIEFEYVYNNAELMNIIKKVLGSDMIKWIKLKHRFMNNEHTQSNSYSKDKSDECSNGYNS